MRTFYIKRKGGNETKATNQMFENIVNTENTPVQKTSYINNCSSSANEAYLKYRMSIWNFIFSRIYYLFDRKTDKRKIFYKLFKHLFATYKFCTCF